MVGWDGHSLIVGTPVEFSGKDVFGLNYGTGPYYVDFAFQDRHGTTFYCYNSRTDINMQNLSLVPSVELLLCFSQ
jgi:hypothetical protein